MFDTTIIHVNPKPTLPYIAPEPDAYVPMPYIFRVPVINSMVPIKDQPIRCPPFHILLDHTIAVIWSLYSIEETSKLLGINQLQWALAFLNNIKNERGAYNKDVTHCINTITDALINQYAEMIQDVQEMKDASPTKIKKKIQFNSTILPLATSSPMNVSQEAATTSRDNSPHRTSELFASPNVPFSITYADMSLRSPSKEDIDTTNYKSVVGDELNKTKLKDFLSNWRRDQISKIFLELDRLGSIEKFISSEYTSSPQMNEDDKQMQVLLVEKMKNLNNNFKSIETNL